VIKIARAKYQTENLHFQVLDVVNLPFPDNSFTTVVSFETIEHLKDQVKFMAEIKRVLQPAGKLIISTPDKEMTDYLGINNPFHVQELNRTEFTVLLSNNFKNIKLFGQRPVKRLKLTQKLIQKLYFIYRKFKWLEFLKSLFSENIKAGISKDISGLSADFSVREIKTNQDYLYYIIVAEK